jgi:hypothetical protein
MFNWNLIYRVTWGLLAIVATVAAIMMFRPKLHQHRATLAEKTHLEELERQDRELLQALKEKQDRFARDPRFVEQVAHDMGMARPGEVLFKFEDIQNEPLILPARP